MAAPKKGPHLRKRLSRSSASINPDGEKPSEFLAHFERFTTKQRRTMFDQVTAASRINCKTFLANKEKARFPIPLHEKKRVVLNVAVRGSKQKTDSREDDKNEEKKWRPLTLMHFEAWPSDTWPDLDLLGPFVHALSRREVQIMRQSVDSYVPPVVIQSHDGLGRGPVVWVSTILMKDIEKKECFDVEDLAKKCAKSRPGAFHKKIHFCVLLALAFRLASLGGWTALEVTGYCYAL